MYVVAADDQKEYQLGPGRADFGQDMVMSVQVNELQEAESSGGLAAAGLGLADMTGHTHDSGSPLVVDRMRVEKDGAERCLAEAGMVLDIVVLEIQSADRLQLVAVLVQVGSVDMDMGHKRRWVGTEKSHLDQK